MAYEFKTPKPAGSSPISATALTVMAAGLFAFAYFGSAIKVGSTFEGDDGFVHFSPAARAWQGAQGVAGIVGFVFAIFAFVRAGNKKG